MDSSVLHFKEMEYSGRLGTALLLNEQPKVRKLALSLLIVLRLRAREYHNMAESKWAEARTLERSVNKAEAQGIKFPFGEQRVKALKAERDEAEKALAAVGTLMCTALDIWQNAGATFADLCNLCNKFPDQVKPHLLDGWESEPFSQLVTVYNLDYKNPRDTGWLEDSVDAPLTHALKAYMLDVMLNTEIGQKAAHEALTKTFPELWDHAIHLVTDADGVKHLIDKDGIEIGTVEDNET